MEEIWRNIKGFEGLYQVSNFGRIKSLNYRHTKKERIMKLSVNNCGYLYVNFHIEGKNRVYMVHRLVAETFIPNPKGYKQVNHINEDKTDNRVENLEWCTAKYNVNYGNCIKKRSSKRVGILNTKISKQVLQFDINGNFIREWPSTREIERTLGYNHNNICSCCNGKINQAYRYVWKYKN